MLLANFVFGQSATIQLSGVNADDYYVHCSSGSYSFTALNSGITGPNITWRIDSTSNNVKPYVFQNIATPTLNYFQGSTEKIYLFLLKVEDASANIYWDTVRVAVAPKLTLSSFPTTWCKDDGNILLNQASIAGGTWSLTPSSYLLTSTGNSFINVSSITASTNILATYSHTYSFEAKSCVQTVNETVTVNPNPIVSFQGLPTQIFKCGTPVQLTGTPSGGTFTLNNGTTTSTLINGVFDPSNLTDNSSYTVTYSYTDPTTGCSAESAQNVFVAGLSQYVALKRGSQFGYLNSSNTFISSLTGISQIINTSFSPNPIYSVCGGLQSETFKLYFNPSTVSSFTSISINWGDGNSISPTFNAQNPEFIHTYVQAGFYTVTYTLSNATCSYTKSVNIFFGTIPGLSISLPSNATACLLPNDSIYYDFEIPNALTAPSGLIYSFSSNHDGTGSGQGPSKKFSTPFIDNGVSISPDTLIYDPINQTVSYRKWFWKSSCGFSSSQGGTWYNSFDFVVGVESPCGASGGGCAPVVLSTSPIAGIQMDTTVCANSNSTILDNSIGGQAVTSYQSNTACGSLNNGYWLIEPATFTVVSGALGSISPFDVNNPSSWNTFPNQIGSNSITIKFNNSGNYKVSRIIGVGINGLSSCTIDTAIEYICVDTIPIVSVPLPAVDTICQNGTILVKFDKDSVNCSEVSQYQIKAWTTTGSTPAVLTQTTASTDTAQILTLNSSGKYALEYIAVNSCGSSSIWDTIIVLDFPLFEFTNPSVVVCDDSALVTLGLNAYTLDSYNQYPVYDSMTYTISPSTGWNIISQNAYGLDDIQFYVPGSYTITVTIYSECGTDLAVLNLMINAPPVAAFSIPNESGCGASSFTPINTSTSPAGIPLQFNWSINANPSSGPYTISTDTSQSPLITIPAPSGDSVNYLVKLVVTDSLGCQDSLTLPYTSYPNPTAAFGINSVYCYPDTVQPIDASLSGFSNSAATYRWIVWDNGGKVDSAFTASPSFSFPNPSAVSKPYTLQLIVTNAVGCSDTISHPFIYSQTPTSNLTGPSPAFSCAPDTVVIYTGATGDSLTINWGISSIGTYTPSLVVYNQDSAQAIFPDLQYPDSDQVLLFTNSVTNPNNCSASSSLTYTIHARPLAKFGMPSDSCGVFALAPVDSSGSNSSITNWSWSISPSTGVNILDPTTQTPTFNLPKSFNGVQNYRIYLTVTDSNGCQDTTSRAFQVNPTPVASFNAQMDTCTGTSLYNLISNTSQSNATDPSLTYLWTITNTTDASSTPIASTLAIPTDTLVNTDDTSHIYVLSLSVTNSYGCDSTTYDTLVVHPNAIAQIVTCPPAQCAPLTLTSNNLIGLHYPNANDVMSTYKWSILDSNGTLLTTQWGLNSLNYIINGSNQGVTLRLTAYSLYGCDSSSDSCSVYTLPNPDPGFTISPILCSNDLDSVLIVNDPLHYQKWTLTFNNSVVLGYPIFNQQPNFSTLSSSPGTYVLTHKVWLSADSTGCDSTTSQSFTIYTAPTPTIAFPGDSSACGAYTLLPTVGNQTSNFTSIQWRVNDPTINILNDTTTTPSISFPKSFNGISNYTIQLVVTDTNGCIDSTSRVFSILPTPVAQFGLVSDTACSGVNLAQRITNLSTSNYPSDTTLTYQWTIINTSSSPIDTITSNTKVPVVSLINTGDTTHIYTITLRVLNAFSCDSTVSSVFKVHPNAKAQIDSCSAGGCAPFTVTSSNVVGHHYPYANDLTSTYKWTILDANNNVLGVQIGLNALNYTIQASNSSIKLRLTAYSLYGCDSAMDSCNVFTQGNPDPGFTLVDSAGCSPFQPTILAGSILTGIHTWIIVDAQGDTIQLATTNDTIRPNFTPIANLNTGTSQSYTLYHTIGASGCDSTTSLLFTVFEQLTAQIQHNAPICSDSILSANDVTTGQIQSRFWTLVSSAGDTLNSRLSSLSAQSVSITFPNLQYPTSDSLYYLYLTNVSIDSCTAIDVDTLTIHARPLAKFGVPSDSCGVFALAPVDSSGSNSSITNWSWSISPSTGVNILDPTTQTPTFNLPKSFNGVQNYRIYLTVTDSNGCQDTTSRVFQVNPTPVASFALSTDSICTGTSLASILSNVSVTNDPADTTLTYLWSILNTSVSASTPLTSGLKVPTNTLVNTDTISHIYTLTLTVTNSFGCDSTIQLPLVVHPNAIAQIDSISLADCAPFTISNLNAKAVAFNNANSAYIWTILDSAGTTVLAGPSNTGINGLSYTINASNTYITIQLQAVSLFGCDTATTQVVARSYENPDPDWTFVQDTGCHVFTPAFANVNQTTGTHRWRIFDANNTQIGSTLSGASPALPSLISTNLTGLTVYTIEHHSFVSDTNSCDSVLIKNIYIKPNPIPTIVALPDTNCANETITFTGQSQNPSIISTWEWGINGITLYGTSVSYTFTSPGVYPLYLKTYTQDGCDTIVRDTITIHSYPYVDFQTLSSCGLDTVCVNQVFNLQNFSTSDSLGGTLTTYLWDILNDGTYEYTSLNPSHTFTAIGSYPIRLRVVNEFGCFTDTLHTIFVNSAPIATISFQDSSICGPVVPIFTEGGSGIIDSTHYELYAFNNAGSKVTLASWANTTPVLPPLVPNYYNDTLYVISKANFNCCGFSIDYDSIYIKTPPVANWSVFPDSGCTPVQIIFQLDGFVHGNADSAFIDFGDGSSQSFLANKVFTGSGYQYLWGQKSHVYTYSGFNDTIFIATLNVYNECGDSSISAPIYVQPNTVQASLQANKLSGCAPLTVQFTNTSYNATNVGWYFNWDPSSGTGSMTSNLNNPQWTFTTPGSYLVALAVDNGCGFDTAYTTITVDPSPTASFTYPSSICQGDTALFISTSSISNGNIVGYLWDFGDGDTSILQNPSHIFNASGSFDVTLIVTSYNGCQDSITHPVLVLPQPLIGFSYNDTCLTDTTYFLNLSTIPSGGFAGIFWDFGDGNVSNQWSPKHVYQAAGTYTVTLQLVSDSGCVSALAQDVDVYPLPNLSFAPLLTAGDSCSVPQTYTFNNTSTNTQQYLWDFDYVGNPGINTSTLTSPSFTYTTAGVYTVMLVGETGYGCRDTIFRNLLIRDGVIAQFLQSPVAGCQPLEVTFKDTSIYTASLDTILSITWDFGDGTSITLTDTPWVYTHTYVQYGTYFPTQTVTMASGCSDIIVGQMVQVYPTPVAGFSIQKVNLNTRQFLNQSITVDTAISYYWTFGDGSWSTEENPVHEYDPNIIGLDSIKICLRVTNSYGCVDSTCTTIWIWPPNLDVPNALAPGLNYVGEDAIFLPKGHSLGQYELEIFDVWGNVVFRTTELDSDGKPSEGWDGRDMRTGNPCAMGVYAWRIRAVFDNGERWVGRTDAYGGCSECGTLTLLR